MDKDEDKASLEKLSKSIEKAKQKIADEEKNKESSAAGATRVGIELVAGVVVGTVIGFFIDKFLGTMPLFFIICFFLGCAASALNIYRLVNNTKDKD